MYGGQRHPPPTSTNATFPSNHTSFGYTAGPEANSFGGGAAAGYSQHPPAKRRAVISNGAFVENPDGVANSTRDRYSAVNLWAPALGQSHAPAQGGSTSQSNSALNSRRAQRTAEGALSEDPQLYSELIFGDGAGHSPETLEKYRADVLGDGSQMGNEEPADLGNNNQGPFFSSN